MPRRLASLRLWLVVCVLTLAGMTAMALGADRPKGTPAPVWPQAAAI